MKDKGDLAQFAKTRRSRDYLFANDTALFSSEGCKLLHAGPRGGALRPPCGVGVGKSRGPEATCRRHACLVRIAELDHLVGPMFFARSGLDRHSGSGIEAV